MIGASIRERRLEMGLSLREMAERCGLTASFLSLVERDLVSPSIASLRQIASALDVPIFYFLVDEPIRSPVVRQSERRRLILTDPDVTYELLTPSLGGKLEVFLCHLPPGTGNIAKRLPKETEECIVVLQGKLDIQLNGQDYILDAGDSAYFTGSMLNRLCAAGEEEVIFISSITPPVF